MRKALILTVMALMMVSSFALIVSDEDSSAARPQSSDLSVTGGVRTATMSFVNGTYVDSLNVDANWTINMEIWANQGFTVGISLSTMKYLATDPTDSTTHQSFYPERLTHPVSGGGNNNASMISAGINPTDWRGNDILIQCTGLSAGTYTFTNTYSMGPSSS